MSVTLLVRELSLSVDEAREPEAPLYRAAAARLGLRREQLSGLRIVRRALDARHQRPRFVFSVEVQAAIAEPTADRLVATRRAERPPRPEQVRWRMPKRPEGPAPVVVGAGPAGLFAAIALAEAGWPPLVVERGKQVEPRARDVSKLYARGILDTESNVCYGEGGAGTFSDGKLYTRVGDPRVERVLAQLVARGADPDILVDNRPHLGTDRLVALLASMRAYLESLGATFRFGTRVDDFEITARELRALRLAGGERLEARRAILATGHSAREVWERLDAAGLSLEARPYAVGFRVEHPQALIDDIRYGGRAGELPAADYRLTYNEPDGRAVYSFCMCPGGVVVATPTRHGALCINGMSHASRAGRYANSALVVTVGPPDFAAAGHRGVFAGVAFQEAAERAAYAAGGGAFVAPASRLSDFAAGRVSGEVGDTSYRRGLWPADLAPLYPAPVIEALRRALGRFERSMRGFLTSEATLIGVETRTASPIRVPRGEDGQASGCAGLYPAGEGMGYGGGIMSAAVDGARVAEAMLAAAGAVREVS